MADIGNIGHDIFRDEVNSCTGLLSSAISIAGEGFQLSIALNTFSRGKSFPPEIHALATSITRLSLALKQAAALVQKRPSICSKRAVADLAHIAKCSNEVFDEVDDRLEDVQQEIEREDASDSDARHYVRIVFDPTRVDYLLAHLNSLELSSALFIQILRLGKIVALSLQTKDSDQQTINELAIEQERIVAQDLIFVRHGQTSEVYRTYKLAQDANDRERAQSPGSSANRSDDTADNPWLSLYSLGPLESGLQNLLRSEEDMSNISQETVVSLVKEWTVLYDDAAQVQQVDISDQDIGSVQASMTNYNNRGQRLQHSTSRYNSANDDEDRPRRRSKSYRRYSSSDSTDSYAGSREKLSSLRVNRRGDHYSDSDTPDGDDSRRARRRYRQSSRSRFSPSLSPNPSKQQRKERTEEYNNRTSANADDESKNPEPSKQDENPKTDGETKKDEKKDDDKKEDSKDDGKDKKDGFGLGDINPLTAMMFPSILKQVMPSDKKNNDAAATPATVAATESPTNPVPPPSAPIAYPQALSQNVPPQNAGLTNPPVQTHSGQPVQSSAKRFQPPGHHTGGMFPSESPHRSTAASRYTPHGPNPPGTIISPQAQTRPSVSPGPPPPSVRQQYADRDQYAQRYKPAELNSPPHDHYRRDGSAQRFQQPAPTPIQPYHTSSPGTYPPNSQYIRPAPSNYAPGVPPVSVHQPPQPLHSPHQDHLSPPGMNQSRYSLPSDRLTPESAHHPHSTDTRPSHASARVHGTGHPYDEHRSGRPSSRDRDRSHSRDRRYERSRSRDRRDRKNDDGTSSRPSSHVPLRTGRSTPAKASTYKYKPSGGGLRVKPANARAASRLLGPIKLSPNFIKGLTMVGKGLASARR